MVKRLGIANQSVDASNVAASDPSEVERLKKNFVIKKLGQEDNEATEEAAGIVAYDGEDFPAHRASGQVGDIFGSQDVIESLPGHRAVGQLPDGCAQQTRRAGAQRLPQRRLAGVAKSPLPAFR